MLLHFAERIAGELLHPHKRPGNFKGGQLFTAAGLQHVRGKRAVRNNISDGHFAPQTVGHSGHSSFRHFLLLHEELFKLDIRLTQVTAAELVFALVAGFG